jgi:hypothetical protein
VDPDVEAAFKALRAKLSGKKAQDAEAFARALERADADLIRAAESLFADAGGAETEETFNVKTALADVYRRKGGLEGRSFAGEVGRHWQHFEWTFADDLTGPEMLLRGADLEGIDRVLRLSPEHERKNVFRRVVRNVLDAGIDPADLRAIDAATARFPAYAEVLREASTPVPRDATADLWQRKIGDRLGAGDPDPRGTPDRLSDYDARELANQIRALAESAPPAERAAVRTALERLRESIDTPRAYKPVIERVLQLMSKS